MSRQRFLVEGIYDDEPQITADLVLAETEEHATELVRKVREITCHSGSWVHDRTITPLAYLEEAVGHLKVSEADLETAWDQTKTDLYYRQCKKCGAEFGDDDGFDDERGLCEKCAGNTCRTCGGPGASAGDASDGECPSCADRTSKNEEGRCAGATCENKLPSREDLIAPVEGQHLYCSEACKTATEG